MIHPLSGSDCQVYQDHNTFVVEWRGPGRVVFSFSRRGQAINAHFATDKQGLRHLKPAISEFCAWIFVLYDWCTMIFAMILKPSVERLVKKCGFLHLTNKDDYKIYMRQRSWAV